MSAHAIREAIQTAILHCRAPMVLSDPSLPDCPIIAVNPSFVELTGYPAHDLIGVNCRKLQGPKTDPGTRERLRACIAAEQGCIEWIINYRRDGSLFWNLLFVSPVRDTTGKLVYFFGNQLDVTLGFPNWLIDVTFGRAHVRPELEHEFHALLREVDMAARIAALERVVAAAHRLAEISTRLTPGTLDQAYRR